MTNHSVDIEQVKKREEKVGYEMKEREKKDEI